MSNLVLAWNNRVDTATLSGGSWQATLPVSNMKDRQVQKVARTTDVTLGSTQFNIDMGATVRSIDCIALVVHNLSEVSKIRITGWLDAGYTANVYDSGFVDVWSAGIVPDYLLEWEGDNFWLGTMDAEMRAGYNAPYLHLMNQSMALRYWRIEIDDTSNSSGYVQIGRLFMAQKWSPTYSMSYGAKFGYEDVSLVETSLSGAEYFDPRTRYRMHKFDLNCLNDQETYQRILELQRTSGKVSEVLIVPDSSDKNYRVQRGFVGRMTSFSPLSYDHFHLQSVSLEIKELI